MSEQPEPVIQVLDKRRFLGPGDVLLGPDVVIEREPPPTPTVMQVGEYYEINGICYHVLKADPTYFVLTRFHGRLLMPKANATAIQLRGAKAG